MPCLAQKEFPSFAFEQRDWIRLSKDEFLGQAQHTLEKRGVFWEGETVARKPLGEQDPPTPTPLASPHTLKPCRPLFYSSAIPCPHLPLRLSNARSICLECFPWFSSFFRPHLSHRLLAEAFLSGCSLPYLFPWHPPQSVLVNFLKTCYCSISPLRHEPHEGRTSSVLFLTGSLVPKTEPSHIVSGQ